MPTHDARTDDGLPQVPERFDEASWDGFDPGTSAFLAAMAAAAGIVFETERRQR